MRVPAGGEARGELVRRSMLIVPVHMTRFVEKAHERGADAILLDMEDSVPEAQKQEARAALPEAVKLAGRSGADVLVRINKPWLHAFLDLDAAVIPGVTGILVPKAEEAADIVSVDRLIEERERARGLTPRSIQLSLSIESAVGMMHDLEIAMSTPRLRTITSGIEDFATDLQLQLSDDASELWWIKARIVLVARVAGLVPMGVMGGISDYTDLDAFRAAAERARRFGYQGAGCIHPKQVSILNQVFSPSPRELEHAQRVVEGAKRAETSGQGAFSVEGAMADIATVKRAARLVERARIIQERDEAFAARQGAISTKG